MSDSTTKLDLIATSQAQKEVTANALFDAASPAMLFGRRALTTAGLTWGYYGGSILAGGAPLAVANGTVTLTASATNYIEANPADGAVSHNTSGFTFGRVPLYQVVTDPASVSSYTDVRNGLIGFAAILGDGDKGDIVVSSGGLTWTIDSAVLSAYARTLTAAADAATARGVLGLGSAAILALDTDATLAANSDSRIASQKAVKAYVDTIITSGAVDVMIFKGVIDCSANPNYPAADAGAVYKVSVAGKIGGASGVNVEAGDTAYCIADGTAAGTQAAVGASWNIAQANIDGAVTGPTSAVNLRLAVFNGTSGKVIKDGGAVLSTDGTFAANSDANVPTEKAVKTYVAAATGGSQPYDVTAFFPGVPTASALVTRIPFSRAVSFPASLTGSVGKSRVAANAQTDFDVQKNGVSVATIRFAASASTASFIAASAFSMAAGDVLAIIAPGTADALLADIGFVLAGTR